MHKVIFLGMEEFYSYKDKTLQKRQSREIKYNNTTTTKNIYIYLSTTITIYNMQIGTKQINSSGTAYLLMYLVINAA